MMSAAVDGWPLGVWMPTSNTYRVYPLTPRMLEAPDGVIWWSKGHHDAAEFIRSVQRNNLDYFGDQPAPIDVARVTHEWWATRQGWGMTGPGGDYPFLYQPVEATARGAYPVTAVML